MRESHFNSAEINGTAGGCHRFCFEMPPVPGVVSEQLITA
ncbi:hypothetical protein SynWH8101_0264 [Synechococcus sp. WH 8101]|nr:hypothetical protein SynWH8101_0264 [Synechococcus sp. WH 8101]